MRYLEQKCFYFMQWIAINHNSIFFIPLLKRLPSVDLGQLNREQLVKIFRSYAMPIHKRSKHVHTTFKQIEQSEQLSGSQRTIHLKRKPESNVEKSTDGSKRIKFTSIQEEELTPKMRMHDEDSPMVNIL